MKFPTLKGVGEVKGDQAMARKCYTTGTKGKSYKLAAEVELDSIDRETIGVPVEKMKEVPLSKEVPDKFVKIGSLLSEAEQLDLLSCLQKNKEVFAWTPEDLPGINQDIAVHRLAIAPNAKPVAQKKRSMSYEKMQATKAEIEKLLQAGFIEETQYADWLSNVVLVKKANGKWRMCVDFSDLNKHCPKDSYPLPRIDYLVDSTAGHELLSLMDAYSGYNQIKMHTEDATKTAFITDYGVYYYKVMPFGLKNAGATFQRAVDTIFRPLLGETMEAYVDDLLVKSKKREDHPQDLQKAFSIMLQFGVRLNPEKCSFGISAGKFLGYMVSSRGIEPNLDKVKAILDMQPPRNITEAQSLAGKVIALGRFISRLGDRCNPFFKTWKNLSNTKGKGLIDWTPECQRSFDQLKEFLSSPPILSSPVPGESLFLYLAVSEHAISAVLIRVQGKVQFPVYYISRVLKDVETRYLEGEKLALALVFAARRLRPYFQAHEIIILTNHPLRQILGKPEVSGRLAKWAIELSEYDLQYKPRPAIKAQAIVVFIVETTRPVYMTNSCEL
jgi:hypothetical protein